MYGLRHLGYCRRAAASQSNGASRHKGVSETFFGNGVNDPYRNLEDNRDPSVALWMRMQSDYARATLNAIPGRTALLRDFVKFDSAVSDRVAQVTRLPEDRWFIERRPATADQFMLYARDGLLGPDVLLVDPDALKKATGRSYVINWFRPAGDGKLVAYDVSPQDADEPMLHILDSRSGQEIGKPISRADL